MCATLVLPQNGQGNKSQSKSTVFCALVLVMVLKGHNELSHSKGLAGDLGQGHGLLVINFPMLLYKIKIPKQVYIIPDLGICVKTKIICLSRAQDVQANAE